eukprot:7312899-Alexandrium_andersonii.AAC.1
MSQYSRQFELSMVGTGPVEDYWANAARATWGTSHPVLVDPAYSAIKHLMIPVVWQSDGAEIFKGAEFHVCSWASALSYDVTNVLDQKFLCCAVEEARLVDG